MTITSLIILRRRNIAN